MKLLLENWREFVKEGESDTSEESSLAAALRATYALHQKLKDEYDVAPDVRPTGATKIKLDSLDAEYWDPHVAAMKTAADAMLQTTPEELTTHGSKIIRDRARAYKEQIKNTGPVLKKMFQIAQEQNIQFPKRYLGILVQTTEYELKLSRLALKKLKGKKWSQK